MTELSQLLPKALRQLPPSDELTEKLVLSVWERAVGETLAQRARPFRLHQSTLVVSVPSLMWKRELHHLQEEIIQRLSKAIGRKVVFALEFRVDDQFDSRVTAPFPGTPESSPGAAENSKSVDLSLDCIEDLGLRRSLAAAASSYLNRPR